MLRSLPYMQEHLHWVIEHFTQSSEFRPFVYKCSHIPSVHRQSSEWLPATRHLFVSDDDLRSPWGGRHQEKKWIYRQGADSKHNWSKTGIWFYHKLCVKLNSSIMQLLCNRKIPLSHLSYDAQWLRSNREDHMKNFRSRMELGFGSVVVGAVEIGLTLICQTGQHTSCLLSDSQRHSQSFVQVCVCVWVCSVNQLFWSVLPQAHCNTTWRMQGIFM